MKTLFLLIIYSLLIPERLFAASVSIPIEDTLFTMKPAADLVNEGVLIDAYKAFELQRSGVDLSELEPYSTNLLWKDQKLPIPEGSIQETQYHFSDYKLGPREHFHAFLKDENGSSVLMTASLGNHTNIIRATLLRKLGYDIIVPQFFKKITIDFKNEKVKNSFLKNLGEKTLTKRSSWVIENPNKKQLTLKDITLRVSELKNPSLFLPVMDLSKQKSRRLFRAVLLVHALTDFPQSINAINWQVGTIFNGFLKLKHLYSKEFQNVTIDDIKWIYKRIIKLSQEDIKESVTLAGYPDDISQLIVHKLSSRINSVGNLLNLETPFLVDRNFTIMEGNIYNGELESEQYENYVVDFYSKDAESPYNFNKLFKHFQTQATYNALSTGLEQAISKFTPKISIQNATQNIQNKIRQHREANPGKSQGIVPIKIFTSPTASINISARRNVIFGQHMGSSAPIQLVDSVGADASLGVYSLVSGISPKFLPFISAEVKISRIYSHVRPMPDLEVANSQELSKVIVPKLLKSVGQVLKLEFECSIVNTITLEEGRVGNLKVTYIKYDINVIGSKKEAIAKRAELIESGVKEGSILLFPIRRGVECEKELKKKKRKNIDDFLKQFALNETFLINDSITLTGSTGGNIPTGLLLAGQPTSLSLRLDQSHGAIRALTIRKKSDHLEISLQEQNNSSPLASFGLNYFLEIIKGTKKWLSGEQETLIYKVKIQELTEKEEEIMRATIRELLISHKTLYLKENYHPLNLEHTVATQLDTLKLLWHKSDHYQAEHTVHLTLPKSQYPKLSLSEREKTLSSVSSMHRKGSDYMAFSNSLLSLVSSFLSLGQSSNDPAQSIAGRSRSRYYVTEGDISQHPHAAITTKIEYIWRGWSIDSSDLGEICNYIENLYENSQGKIFNRDIFINQGDLRGYEVKSTLIIYPEVIEKFKKEFLDSKKSDAMTLLKKLYGNKKYSPDCVPRAQQGGPRYIRKRNCTPRSIQIFLKLRKRGMPLNREAIIKTHNAIFYNLLENFDRKEVIKWMGKKNIFMNSRITGFLEGTEKGYIDYMSNTFGTYNTELKTGIFDKFSTKHNIIPYELRALNQSPGM